MDIKSDQKQVEYIFVEYTKCATLGTYEAA